MEDSCHQTIRFRSTKMICGELIVAPCNGAWISQALSMQTPTQPLSTVISPRLGAAVPIINPATEETWCQSPPRPQDVERARRGGAARIRSTWRNMAPGKPRNMFAIAAAIRRNLEELRSWKCGASAKPITDAGMRLGWGEDL